MRAAVLDDENFCLEKTRDRGADEQESKEK